MLLYKSYLEWSMHAKSFSDIQTLECILIKFVCSILMHGISNFVYNQYVIDSLLQCVSICT